MKVNEIFESIQGEGRYAGNPALFIRASECNLACDFCDTEFKTGTHYSIEDLAVRIRSSSKEIVIWTGGEPTLQLEEILKVIQRSRERQHHLESNGLVLDGRLDAFSYLCFSPKNTRDAKRVGRYGKGDIKIVTDLDSVGMELIPYATMLMPLTTFTDKDKDIERRVWEYCAQHNIKYSPRLHMGLWGGERGK